MLSFGGIRGLRCLFLTVAVVLALTGSSSAEPVTHSETKTIPGAPASNYAGAGGGDGWDVSFSQTEVFNVFHHSAQVTMACHKQSDASECYSPRTISDAAGNIYSTSNQSGTHFDTATKNLYVYSTRFDSGFQNPTGGVVCIDTVLANSDPNPFCGFTALTPAGDGSTGGQQLSVPMRVGSKLYSFNYVDGVGSTGGKNKLLCFDLSTKAACSGQPFTVSFPAGNVSASAPSPTTAAIGSRLYIPISSAAGERLACFDTSTAGNCAGSWPATLPAGSVNDFDGGSPFPKLDSGGQIVGVCIPDTGVPCYGLDGAASATPPGIEAAINAPSSPYNGQAVTLGARVYLSNGNDDSVHCYDYGSSASCANFPHPLPGAGYTYTVNEDPQRPVCLWVNSDNGSAQIQNFDAFSGQNCGEGPRRVLASQFVVPREECTPNAYQTLQIVSPTRNNYASGSVAFRDGNGNAIPGAADRPLDNTGTADLSGLDLDAAGGLPQFLITVNGGPPAETDYVIKLTWTSERNAVCGDVVAAAPPTPARPASPSYPLPAGGVSAQGTSNCKRRNISLVRARRKGDKVELDGLVVKSLAGKSVAIDANYGAGKKPGRDRRLKTVKTNSKGQFRVSVAPPSRSFARRARYRAKIGKARSAGLKLFQQLTTTSVKQQDDQVVVRGKIQRSLLGRRNGVVVRRLVCGRYRRVGSAQPGRDGSYVVRFKAASRGDVALYRAETRVLVRSQSRKYVKRYARAVGLRLTDETG